MFEIFTYKLQIKESHLDTFGHVNNATYLELYEEARWDFITRGGYGLDKIQATGMGPIILEFNIRYRKELKNREWITITFQVIEDNGKIARAKHEMFKEDGSLASDAEVVVGFFDLNERKLIKPTAEWRKAIGDPKFK
jgi:YbgC/YbaW family acyl-CoA thioester hydrolase